MCSETHLPQGRKCFCRAPFSSRLNKQETYHKQSQTVSSKFAATCTFACMHWLGQSSVLRSLFVVISEHLCEIGILTCAWGVCCLSFLAVLKVGICKKTSMPQGCFCNTARLRVLLCTTCTGVCPHESSLWATASADGHPATYLSQVSIRLRLPVPFATRGLGRTFLRVDSMMIWSLFLTYITALLCCRKSYDCDDFFNSQQIQDTTPRHACDFWSLCCTDKQRTSIKNSMDSRSLLLIMINASRCVEINTLPHSHLHPNLYFFIDWICVC